MEGVVLFEDTLRRLADVMRKCADFDWFWGGASGRDRMFLSQPIEALI